jgi:site-specific DNA recombinase
MSVMRKSGPEAVIYCRISSDPEGAGLGVRRQERDCRDLCERRGWPVAGVYVDNDVSAADQRKARPGYQEMVDRLKQGGIHAVVAWSQDRLVRRPVELEEFVALCEASGTQRLETVQGSLDLGTGDGLLIARIKGAVAADEIARLKARTRRKHQELAERGFRNGGGMRQFGYAASGSEIDDREALVVKEVVQRLLTGETVGALCRDLNAREVTTVTGRRWSPMVLRRMASAASIAGYRERAGVFYEGQWPGIVALEDVIRLRAMLRDRQRPHRTARRYLLTGFLVCSRCGERLRARPRRDGKRCYVCARGPGIPESACGRLSIVAEPVEECISNSAIALVDSPELARAVEDERKERANSPSGEVLAEIDRRLEELASEWGGGGLSDGEWKAARERLDHRRREALVAAEKPAVLRPAENWIGRTGALRDAWPSLNLDKKRAIIAAVLVRVDVAPATHGRTFDPLRLNPVWQLDADVKVSWTEEGRATVDEIRLLGLPEGTTDQVAGLLANSRPRR